MRVLSNTVANLARHFKVSVDDRPKRLDVQVRRGTGISETLAKDDETVIIWVPQRYVTTVECAAKSQEAHVRGLTCDGLELDVRTPRLSLDDVHTQVEVNCTRDMEIACASIDGRIDVNQLSSTSRITVPKDVPIAVLTLGLRTRTIVGAGVRQDEESCAAKSQEAHVRGLTCDGLELDVRTPRLSLDDVHTQVEVNCTRDMEIACASIDGRIDVNQLSSTSRITVPKDVPIAVLTLGLRTRTIVGAGVRQDEESPNIVELTGVASELIIEGR